MRTRNRLAVVAALALVSIASSEVMSGEIQGVVVRIAELEIDRAQLENYKAAVREEIEAAVRLEPGVLAIYSVAEKDNPTRLRFFEIYASDEAYRSHLASPHFKKYFVATKPMILSRRLIETIPVQLSAK